MIARALIFAMLSIAAGASPAQNATSASCQVLDPELQGSYRGGCVGGYAEGVGEARGRAIYSGSFVAGRKHGKGVKTWPVTGDRYEGEFVEDRKHGTGVYVWGSRSASAGERYSGGYVADRRHGHGVYEWPSGERYSGPWESDTPTGAPTKGMMARARAHAEHAAVVGIAGAKVCRELRAGVATVELIRGTVLGRTGDSIRVRIEDAGQMEHVVAGRTLRKGDVLTEPLLSWLPCR